MATSSLKANICFATDKGIKNDNEDFVGSLIPVEPQLTHKGIVAAIADGMSGSDAGKLASQSCVGSFLNDYFSTPDSWSVKQAGQKILSATNSWLYSQGQIRYGSNKGMISTLSIIVLKSTTAHIFHIGDSRIYRLRSGNFELMTRDHRICSSQDHHYLSRAMGADPKLEVDYKALPVQKHDLFLMTTDGIHDFINEKILKHLLLVEDELSVIAESIIQQAKTNRSNDNLSCQLIRVVELPEAGKDEILRRHANLPFPPPLENGTVLDGYRIQAELHASKRTQIYRAIDTVTNTDVILKTPSILFEDDTHFIEHFLYEEWAGKRINHCNIVKVIHSNRPKTCVYYVTEYLSGKTLRDWMNAYPKADINETRKIVEQIAKGLRALHRQEMLHQDLKPENIMFDKYGVAKIIDFGSVKIAGITEITLQELDTEENILGTLNYTAPEYHLGQRGSPKSDLYSLGVIAYEMLNGGLPFGQCMPEQPSKSFIEKLHYVPSFQLNPMIPSWIDGALKKATAISPEARYDELSEFIYDLNHPNPRFVHSDTRTPLVSHNPLRFWQGLSFMLFIMNFIILYLLMLK